MISLNDLGRSALADAADDNLVTHVTWVHRRTAGMRVVDAPDLVLVDSGLACDTFNVICRARLVPGVAPERIRAAVDYFAGVGRPFSWWLSPADRPRDLGELLSAAGLHPADTELAMAADLALLPDAASAPRGLQVRRVHTEAELRDFAEIIAGGWTPPDTNVLRFYELASPTLFSDDAPLWLYVGYLGEVPVATSELTLGGGVAGLYNVVTREAYRRRGFGAALTLQPLLAARARGYRTAVLQASVMGAGVYARLGFEPWGQITEYKPAQPADRTAPGA